MNYTKNEAQIFAYLIPKKKTEKKRKSRVKTAVVASNNCLTRPSNWT